jgi:hypothetical protein
MRWLGTRKQGNAKVSDKRKAVKKQRIQKSGVRNYCTGYRVQVSGYLTLYSMPFSQRTTDY